MTKFVVDTWAWIEYIEGSEKGVRVKEVVENPENEIITHWISLAEIVSFAKRKNKDYRNIIETLNSISSVIVGDAILTGQRHAEMRSKTKDFGLADACVLAAAEKTGAKILTGDPHFEGMKNAVMI